MGGGLPSISNIKIVTIHLFPLAIGSREKKMYTHYSLSSPGGLPI